MNIDDEARERVRKLVEFAKSQNNRDPALSEGLEKMGDAVCAAASGLVTLSNKIAELRVEVEKLEKAAARRPRQAPDPEAEKK